MECKTSDNNNVKKEASKTVRGSLVVVLTAVLFLTCSTQLRRSDFDRNSSGYFNDMARFLAGLPISGDSALWPSTQTPYYQRHEKHMNDFWSRVDRETLSLVRPWREKYMSDIKGSVAFYPLSGADFINLYSMYPDSRYYLMIAMETTGEIPDPLKLSPAKLQDMLESLGKLTYQYGKLNYFLSKIMAEEMCREHKIGATPALLVFLARLGHEVVNVEKIGIDENGTLLPLDSKGLIAGKNPESRGMKFVFFAPDDPRPRVLIYLNMRLSDNSVDPATPSGKFLHRLDKLKTIMKSAVYLLFLRGFGAVKDFIIAKSISIVQDDSGVPFQDLNNQNWDVRIFGAYIPRYPIKGGCKIQKQKDLMESFEKGSLPLPFNFGYGSLLGKNKSNVILAVRKKKPGRR